MTPSGTIQRLQRQLHPGAARSAGELGVAVAGVAEPKALAGKSGESP